MKLSGIPPKIFKTLIIQVKQALFQLENEPTRTPPHFACHQSNLRSEPVSSADAWKTGSGIILGG
jgi:hypothetical protein